MRSGDACVALAGEERRSWEEDEGDASVPTPLSTTPAPTGTKGLAKRHGKIPTRESGGGVDVE